MYSLIKKKSAKDLVLDLPPLAGSLVVAELFYKFGSFSLECVAFLATWFVFDWVWSKLRQLGTSNRRQA